MCGLLCEALKGPKRKACAPEGVRHREHYGSEESQEEGECSRGGWGGQAQRALHSQAEPPLFFMAAFSVLLKNFIQRLT